MTPREIEIMSAFMSLDGMFAQYRFGPSAKKYIMETLNLSPSNLSNFLRNLTIKGFLIKSGDFIDILPLLKPDEVSQDYMFKINLITNEPVS